MKFLIEHFRFKREALYFIFRGLTVDVPVRMRLSYEEGYLVDIYCY